MVGYPGRGLHGETVEKIGVRIISGHYQPGDLLFAEALERELGVSKTVVREAMRVLAAKGLVDSRPKRGTIVTPRESWGLLDPDLLAWRGRGKPDAALLQDLAEVRFIVEPEGARLAAQRRTDQDLLALEDAVASMVAAGDSAEAMIEADLTFHRALLQSAHNELLTRMEVVIEAGLRIRDRLVHADGEWPDPVPDHRALVEAVRARDTDAAVAATRQLLARASQDAAERVVDGMARRDPPADALGVRRRAGSKAAAKTGAANKAKAKR
jgi:DNA-binding FadR family transcriptional regulator